MTGEEVFKMEDKLTELKESMQQAALWRPQRRKMRSDKRPCSSTVEESSSSADMVDS